MVVIISVAHLIGGSLEVCVQRPQHHANASRIYRSSEQVGATLLKFGIAEKALDEVLKLLPQLGTGERLKLTPIDVTHHDLDVEGFKLEIRKQRTLSKSSEIKPPTNFHIKNT